MLMEPSVQKQIAMNIMEGARAMLIQKAGHELDSTRMDYIQGVQPLEIDDTGVSLVLVGALPNMVEQGWEGGFLQDTLLGDNASGWKVAEDGHRYRSIPFRHKTPGASTSQGGQKMGSQFQERGGRSLAAPHAVVEDTVKLGKKIHARAQRLVTKQEKASGKKGNTRLPEGMAPKLRPHHSTDIFAGMIVNKQAVMGTTKHTNDLVVGHQKTYTTFRTISEAVPDKWYHPGIEARNFFDELGPYIEKVAPAAVQAFANEVLG